MEVNNNFRMFKYIGGGSDGPTCAECGSKASFFMCSNTECITNKHSFEEPNTYIDGLLVN